MKKLVLGMLGLLVAVVLIMQLIPVDRVNPPVTAVVPAPPEALAVLRASCWDCHSNETEWPWYSRVAPVSWVVAHDVEEGRSKVNFTTWDAYDAGTRAHLLTEMLEEVEEGEMPLPIYLRMHPEARLTAEDRAALVAWVEGGGAWSPSAGNGSDGDHGGEEHP